MLKLEDFKKVGLESALEVVGGRPEEDPNVTPGGEVRIQLTDRYLINRWSSDYNGVNGIELCDSEIFTVNL